MGGTSFLSHVTVGSLVRQCAQEEANGIVSYDTTTTKISLLKVA